MAVNYEVVRVTGPGVNYKTTKYGHNVNRNPVACVTKEEIIQTLVQVVVLLVLWRSQIIMFELDFEICLIPVPKSMSNRTMRLIVSEHIFLFTGLQESFVHSLSAQEECNV